MDYTYKRIASRGFQETRNVVERAAVSHGFEVRHVHDLQATLAAKGFPIQSLCIFELWLGDTDRDLGEEQEGCALMPCRVHVYVEGGEVCVAAIRPTLAALMFPELDFGGLDGRIERRVRDLVDACSS